MDVLVPAVGRLSVELDHVQIVAPPDGEAAARSFFGAILGLVEIEKPAALASRGGVWFAIGDGHQLHVGVVAAGQFVPAAKAHAGLRVSPKRLEQLAGRLVADDYPVIWAPAEEIPGTRRLYTTDPWGNRLELLADAS